jgi:hypothetical protein
MEVQQMDETSLLIRVRLSSEPNFSNQMIPVSMGRMMQQPSDAKAMENILKLVISLRPEKKFILTEFFRCCL